jgi:hypothetical protein
MESTTGAVNSGSEAAVDEHPRRMTINSAGRKKVFLATWVEIHSWSYVSTCGCFKQCSLFEPKNSSND